jgi:hypothetical protein
MRAALIILVALLPACQEFTIGRGDGPKVPTQVTFAPDISVSPAALGFGEVVPGCTTGEQLLTVVNTGTSALSVREVVLEGLHATAYTVQPATLTLAPGQQATLAVSFTPAAAEAYDQASVVILSDDPDEARFAVPVTGTGGEAGILEEAFEQGPAAAAVDLLFVIDNSGSMAEEVDRLALAFDTLLSTLDGFRLDYQLGVTTTDTSDRAGALIGPILTAADPDPAAAFAAQLEVGTIGSGEERGIDAAYAALTAPRLQEENAGLLRPEADLAVVIVSDEDDGSLTDLSAFLAWFDALKQDPERTSLSGLVGPDSPSYLPHIACDLRGGARATTAPRYHDAISATGGAFFDICEGDAAAFLDLLSYVTAGVALRFPLQEEPTAISEVEVRIDEEPVAYGADVGWTWDAASNSVLLGGPVRAGPGATVTIRYPYEASCLP